MEERKKGMTWEDLFSYERGYIWDLVTLYAGVNNLNLTNIGDTVANSPLRYVGDVRYNMFAGTHQRLAQQARRANPAADEAAREAARALGVKTTRLNQWHTYYGQLIDYSWHRAAHEQGTHFTPIYHLIERISAGHPEDAARLEVLRRRLVYAEILEHELKFIVESYDPDVIRVLPEWTTNKTETYVTQVAQTAVLILEYRNIRLGGPTDLRFEDFVRSMPKDQLQFTSLNTLLESYLIISLRNQIVHASTFTLAVEEGRHILHADISRGALSFGSMEEYLRTDIASKQIGERAAEETVSGVEYVSFRDPRFSYLTILLRKGKGGRAVLSEPILRYQLDLENFAEMVGGFLYRVADGLLRPVAEASKGP